MVQLSENSRLEVENIFQYILCYGSTKALHLHMIPIIKFQYILCYGSTVLLGV